MNESKKTNGWILCPSKSFPGKFYYFNVLNGEAAWSLAEMESKTPKRTNFSIHTVTDKSHSYPEPSSPPGDDSPDTSNYNLLKKPSFSLPCRVIKNPQAPTFEPTFPKYVQVPNIVWMPVEIPPMITRGSVMPQNTIMPQNSIMTQGAMMQQSAMMPPPMLAQPQMVHQTPMFMANTQEVKRKTFDRKPQNGQDCTIYVQSCNIPLSKRFESYSRQSSTEKVVFNKFYETSTPMKKDNVEIMGNKQLFGSIESIHQQHKDTMLREPVFKRVRTQSETRNVQRNLCKSNSLESLLNSDYIALQKSSLNLGNKVENANLNKDIQTDTKTGEDDKDGASKQFHDLDRSDLRFLLVAKRRKSVDLGDCQDYSEVSGKKIKTYKTEEPRTAKKHVTFDLGVESSNGSHENEEEDDMNYDDTEEVPLDYEDPNAIHYVVSDIETLLDDLKTIEEYVRKDEKRRLLITHALRAEIEAATLGDCGGRQRVIVARQIARKIVEPPDYYVIQPESEDTHETSEVENYTFNCCLDILSSGDHVTLITNNPHLYSEAKALNITCYKTQEIKDGGGNNKPEVSFELKKVQNISVTNENNRPNSEKNNVNPFLQAKQFDSSPVRNKDQNPVKILQESNFTTKKTNDANTSPIDSEKLSIITRKLNQNSIFDFEKSNVEAGLKNLFIKENRSTSDKERPVAEKLKMPECQKTVLRFENGTSKLGFERIEKRKEVESSREKKVFLQKVFEEKSSNRRFDEDSFDEVLNECVVDKNLEDKIKIRIDEFICVFTQIMENALTEVLIRDSPLTDKLTPPWVLFECVKKIQQKHITHSDLKIITEKFKELLVKDSSQIGKLKLSIKPNDFMKILGCGIILIQTLKTILPNHKELYEAEVSLQNLLQGLLQPIEDFPMFTTPVLRRCDLEDPPEDKRHNFCKRPSEIIEYLKAHYPEWKNVEIPDDSEFQANKNEPKILRTVGRNLNLLNIDKSKTITFKDPVENAIDNTLFVNQNITKDNKKPPENTFDKNENLPTSTNFSSFLGNTRKETEIVRKFDFKDLKITRKVDTFSSKPNDHLNINIDDLNIPRHGNTFNQETAGPKVIRTFENLFLQKVDKDKEKSNNDSIFAYEIPKKQNLFLQEIIKEKTEDSINKNDNLFKNTEIVRRAKVINSLEAKLNKPDINLDALDYDEYVNSPGTNMETETMSIESRSFVYEIKEKNKITIKKDNVPENANESYKVANDVITLSDSVINCDSSDKLVIDESNDSGFDNDSIRAYSFARMFLSQLSSSFKAIYQFIDKSITEFKEDEMQENERRLFKQKANRTHVLIGEIIDNLKSIIQRETDGGSTFKELLIKAGVQASTDKRMTRYRQVVTKCLEQALMLETALRIMSNLADNDIETLSTISAATENRYFNIYE